MAFLLSSSLSQFFSLGKTEQYIPGRYAPRIVRFCTAGVDTNRLPEFMGRYRDIETTHGKATRVVEEFFLEKFFESVEESGLVDSVKYVEGKDGEILCQNASVYNFINGGRTISVQDSQLFEITQIPRLVKLEKGESKHTIICDIRTSKSRQKYPFAPRIAAAKELVSERGTLSYMFGIPQDVFKSEMSENYMTGQGAARRRSERPRAFQFLDYSNSNLYLVYSHTSQEIKQLGSNALRELNSARHN